jgi:hypothetical protein
MELGSNGIQNKGSGGAPANIDVNFNSNLEGQANATNPLNVNLTDGVNPVTPTSVALTGNDLDIVIPAPVVPSGVLFNTIEPTQYTSYRTGDEGWRVQNGFYNYTPPTYPKVIAELDMTSTNFFNVLKSPLIVNGVSSTTRFVDVNGIQAFSSTGNANLVVIDKLTGMMYSRTNFSSANWDNAIDNALSYSITVNSIVYDDWYLVSKKEIESIAHQFAGIAVNVDTLTSVLLWNPSTSFWTSSFVTFTGSSRFLFGFGERYAFNANILGTAPQLYIRNARNLITAP